MLCDMSRHAEAIQLSDEDRMTLEGWVRAHSSSQQLVKRARVVLMAAEGASNTAIAQTVGLSRPRVIEWRGRFVNEGLEALRCIRPGRGRKSSIGAEKVRAIVEATTQTTPRAATQWSCRTMAKAQGVSHSTVQRIWDAHGLQPHRVRTFKLSKDPHFVDKLVDIIGLYLNPPDKAAVLCVDEKSQIQALDRTQPGLPLKKGRCGTMTHDYKRNGTTTLFAALELLEGRVIGQCHARHRHQEFLKFLRVLDRDFPKHKDLHLVVDNYGTHKHPKVKAWLAKHPRFHLHFTPTSASWLNLIERWFREITQNRIRRGVFRSVADLVAAIEDYLACHNEDPKPFIWTATVEKILEKVSKCKSIMETLH